MDSVFHIIENVLKKDLKNVISLLFLENYQIIRSLCQIPPPPRRISAVVWTHLGRSLSNCQVVLDYWLGRQRHAEPCWLAEGCCAGEQLADQQSLCFVTELGPALWSQLSLHFTSCKFHFVCMGADWMFSFPTVLGYNPPSPPSPRQWAGLQL